MTDSSRPTRIKVIRKSTKASPDETDSLLWDGCLFCTDAAMTDYDWVLVYDEFPRHDIGTIRNETEPLLCPPDQTILITVEPPSIKIYSRAYTRQFGTVLTTHSPTDLPHPNHTLGRGCLEWLYIKPMQEILDQKEFPKTKMLSTICSAKQHTHTMHKKRYDLTRYLADRLPEDAEVRVFVEHNDNFRLPANPDTPVIMVGPGTGIAPFRAFLQEREAQGAEGKNWLFFGNPHFTQDFLYQVEWQRYVKSGLLSKISLAFSRDQANKIYVQDRLREAGLELYQWLEAGAHFYVCGDANHMAKDVQEALLEVIAEHGHKSREEAEEYLSELRRAKRYQRDVY